MPVEWFEIDKEVIDLGGGMETRTAASLFTGGGGFEQGAIMAGLTPLGQSYL